MVIHLCPLKFANACQSIFAFTTDIIILDKKHILCEEWHFTLEIQYFNQLKLGNITWVLQIHKKCQPIHVSIWIGHHLLWCPTIDSALGQHSVLDLLYYQWPGCRQWRVAACKEEIDLVGDYNFLILFSVCCEGGREWKSPRYPTL